MLVSRALIPNFMAKKSKQNRDESSLRGLRTIGLVTGIPMVMVAGLLVGYFFGSWIDQTFKIEPWGKVVLSILGVIAGIKQTIHLIRESTKENGK